MPEFWLLYLEDKGIAINLLRTLSAQEVLIPTTRHDSSSNLGKFVHAIRPELLETIFGFLIRIQVAEIDEFTVVACVQPPVFVLAIKEVRNIRKMPFILVGAATGETELGKWASKAVLQSPREGRFVVCG